MELGTLIFILWTASFMIIMLVLMLVAWKQIKLKWQAILGKRRDKGLVIELKKNRSIREHFVKFTKDSLELGKDPKRVYNIEPDHVFMSDDWGCKAIVVSEALKSSMNPSAKGGLSALDSDTITALIKRAKSAGQQEALDFIQRMTKMIPLVLVGMGVFFVIVIVMLMKIMTTVSGGKLI